LHAQLPSSVALPFGVFERVLAHSSNSAVSGKLSKLEAALCGTPAKDEVTLQEMRDVIVGELQAPPELHSELVWYVWGVVISVCTSL